MAKNSCQKKPNYSEILGTKVVQFWCYTKSIKTKNVLLNWYPSMKFFFKERFRWFLTFKIDFENQILALFDGYFWPFNKSHEKNQIYFCNQCNHASDLKCFYQIPLTWWKTYGRTFKQWLWLNDWAVRVGENIGSSPTLFSRRLTLITENSNWEFNLEILGIIQHVPLFYLYSITTLQIYTAGNGTHVKNVKVTSICRRYYNVEV